GAQLRRLDVEEDGVGLALARGGNELGQQIALHEEQTCHQESPQSERQQEKERAVVRTMQIGQALPREERQPRRHEPPGGDDEKLGQAGENAQRGAEAGDKAKADAPVAALRERESDDRRNDSRGQQPAKWIASGQARLERNANRGQRGNQTHRQQRPQGEKQTGSETDSHGPKRGEPGEMELKGKRNEIRKGFRQEGLNHKPNGAAKNRPKKSERDGLGEIDRKRLRDRSAKAAQGCDRAEFLFDMELDGAGDANSAE